MLTCALISRSLHGRYATFTRRLNKSGFRKAPRSPVGVPPKTAIYFHPMFQRGRKDLLKKMTNGKATTNKKTAKDISNPIQSGTMGSAAIGFNSSDFVPQQLQHQWQPGVLTSDLLLRQMVGVSGDPFVPTMEANNQAGAGTFNNESQHAILTAIGQPLHARAGDVGSPRLCTSGSSIFQLFGPQEQTGENSTALGPIAQYLQQQQRPRQQQSKQQRNLQQY